MTVDRDLIAAGSAAVARGSAESVSGWVNQALAERAAKDRRLGALAEAVGAYEAESGPISDQELAAQARADRQSAVVVRGGSKARPRRRPRAA
ncbi:MAG: hypothetical protein HY906_11715 [Deltaproteobacteria bacterium]|nr:hypothetical protein [Deltaproteobacteria bacterium]